MRIKKIFIHWPLIAALFLMGCSYGCDSKTKIESDLDYDYEEEGTLEEEESDTAMEALEEEDLEAVVEEINEEDPVTPNGSENIPAEEDSEDDSDSEPESAGSGEGYDDNSNLNSRFSGEEEVAEPDQPEENFEAEEEPYIDNGEDYPDR